MKTTSKLSRHDYTLIKYVIVGTFFICFCALFFALADFFSHAFIIELATTLVAMMVSLACLSHIYREHQKWVKKELRLKSELISKIYYTIGAFPSKRIICAYVEKILDKQSSQLKRIDKLHHYQNSPKAFKEFIKRFRKHHAHHEVLKDLGLHWE